LSASSDIWSLKTSTSSSESLLGVSASSSATAATYNVVVNKMAKAHTVRSDAQTSSSTPLYLSGKFYVNSKEVSVTYTDSLQSIQNKINSTANVGVTASIVDNTLRIKSNQTGATQVTLSDELGASTLTANSSNPAVLTANITGSPTIGDYTFNVTQLAIPGTQDAIFTVTKDGVTTPYTRSSNNFSDVIPGVDVTLSGTSTSTLTIYKSDAVLRNLGLLDAGGAIKNELVQGQNAEIVIDGQTVTRTTNVIDDAISGVTLTLKGESATAVTVTVGSDAASIKSKITDFVNTYNAAYKLVNDKLTEITVSNPKNDTDRQKGALHNDYQLRQIKSDLRRLIGLSVDGLPDDMEMLDQIGVHADKTGQLSVNDTELSNALNTDFDNVKSLLTKDYLLPYTEASTGIATRVEHYLYQTTRSLSGDMATRQSTIDNQIKDLQKSIDKWNIKLDKLEAKYRKQFRDMESAMQKMQTQSNWMASQLGSLSQSSQKIR
jgi:flagellar hook-associated protein 2